MALFLLPQRGDHSRGDLFSAFRETKDTQSILLASAVSYGTLIQSNQYVNTVLLFWGTLPSNSSPFVTRNIFLKNVLRECDLINLLISMASSKTF